MLQTPEMLNVYVCVLAPFPSNLKNAVHLTRADVFLLLDANMHSVKVVCFRIVYMFVTYY